jgi:hypothetical protein
MRAKTALPFGLIRVCLVRGSLTLAMLAPICVGSESVLAAGMQAQANPQAKTAAKIEKQREKKARSEAKKHEVKPHESTKHAAVKHPNEHPEANSKQHEAAAKKRRGEDKKRESKAKRDEAKKVHPVGLRSTAPGSLRPAAGGGDARHAVNTTARDEAAMDEAPAAMASRVHAWEETKKSGAQGGPHPTSQDGDAGHPASEAGATTGVSNPPPDPPLAEVSRQTDVVSVIRRPGERRPQLEPTAAMGAEPVILPALYTKRGRLVVPPPLKGSHEILVRQNQMADDEGLDRIQDDEDLERMRRAGLLIPLPASAKLHVDERLPANRRYCRPWAALFLEDMGRAFYGRFGEALQVNSAVRTVEFQHRLIHTNGNAAPAEGDSASPHLTGQAVDIGKHGLSLAEIAWLRWYLLPLVQAEKVDVEEEFQQACFHISVYKSYLPRPAAGRGEAVATHRGGAGALAMGLR